jgi:hypothetical protein
MRTHSPLSTTRRTVQLLLLAIASIQGAWASTPPLPPCESAGCNTAAVPAPWPTETLTGGIPLRFHELTIVVPPAPSAISTQADAFFATYGDNSALAIGKTSAGNAANPVPEGMNALEWADVLFTKTPKDEKQNEGLAKSTWDAIILSKAVIIGEGSVTVYHQGSLVAYRVSGENLLPYSDGVIIIDERKPNGFFRIGANRMPRGVFDKILASVKTK